ILDSGRYKAVPNDTSKSHVCGNKSFIIHYI
ncbi:MAG: hypothetical protein ACI90V_005008, partial [Bacillariaceae sp.]